MSDEVTLSVEGAEVTLAPGRGGRISSWVIDGLEVLSGMDDSDVGHGSFPLIPWQGRLTDNSVSWDDTSWPMPVTYAQWALHGLVYTRPWTLLSVTPREAVLQIELGMVADDPWPWPARVVAEYKLDNGSLDTTLRIESAGERFPAELGWHPWFRRQLTRGTPLTMDLGAGKMFERGEGDILTGKLVEPSGGPYDDAFELPSGEFTVRWPGALELKCSTDCKFAVAFDALPDVVCVEPQTAPPDWINREPGIVEANGARSARALWTWTATP